MRGPLLPTLLLLLLLLLAPPVVQARERPALQLLKPNDAKNRTGLALVESTLAYIEALQVYTSIKWLVWMDGWTGLGPLINPFHHPTDLQHPVAVIGIVGPYHTGKSFLLNAVVRSLSTAAPVPVDSKAEAEAQQEVFTIGRGVDPETSGELTIRQWGIGANLILIGTFTFLPPSPSHDRRHLDVAPRGDAAGVGGHGRRPISGHRGQRRKHSTADASKAL